MTLVDELRDRFGVEPVLRVIGVAVSTYYGWLTQAANPSPRRREDAELAVEIAEIHHVSGGTYGSPRAHAMLRRQGRHVGRKRVERLLRDAGLQGAFPRKKWRIPSHPVEAEGDNTRSGPGQPAVHGRGVSPAARACSGWPPSGMCSPTASWAGGVPTAATPT
ncbi:MULTISPECIES: IS3 family transposase [unclassified Micromonospora]|uniref:IS3 family transposase n=1 Tax=unclassified Micromonospora TaxID=2617518 RepID=UPI001303FAF6|nr:MULTISPECIES: IS3 family transposase [unclassified Micromonospora]MDI5937360.1 IS3 family transposase [Micromonospora sp. DH15]